MMLRIATIALSLSFATVALAHDPSLHEAQAKLKPETCEQFADRATYSNDLTDPDIKALKETCDADKKAEKPANDEKQDD